MEAEERPTKLRKLENELANAERIPANQDVSNKVPPSQVDAEVREDQATHHRSGTSDATKANAPEAPVSDSTVSEDYEAPEALREQSTSALPLSKNALKRIRNKERWDATRDARKQKRKQKIAEKRNRKRAAREEAKLAARAEAADDEADRKGVHCHSTRTGCKVREVLLC